MQHRRSATTLSLALSLIAPAAAARPAETDRWQGLPLWGGPVQVAAAPGSPEVAYAATVEAGVYHSLDGGRSWRLSGPGPRGFSAQILAVDPHDPRRLFARGYVGDPHGGFRGLFRSDDAGRRWTRVDRGFGSPVVTAVAFDSAIPGRVYAATFGGLFRSGLYASEDFGATWSPLAFPTERLWGLAVNPAAPRVVLASGVADRGQPAIFRSIDRGRTFVPVHPALVQGFAFDPTRPRRVYAWGGFTSGLLRSDDGGATWTPLATPFTVVTLAVNRSGVVLAGNYEYGVERSVDGGESWLEADRPEDPIGSLAVLADAVLAGGGRGVWRGRPDGIAWKAASDGMRAQYIDSLAVAAEGEPTVWVLAGGGFFQSRDEGATFRLRPARLSKVAVAPAAPQTAYGYGCCAEDLSAGLLKTEDGGASWRLLPYPGVPDLSVLAVDPMDPDVVYAGGALRHLASPCTAMRSTDGGETWRCIAPEPGFYELAIDPHDPRTLYAHFAQRLYRSGDRGESWTRLPARGLLLSSVLLRVDPFVPDRLYAAGPGEIYRSDDGGRSWRRKGAGLPFDGRPYDLLAHPTRPGRLYAAVVRFLGDGWEGGVFRSDDSGEHWREISAGLPDDAFVVTLAADPRGDLLYAGTVGRSLYRLRVTD